MRFVLLGNFAQVHSTEGYVADALAALGHPVTRVQEDSLTPSGLVAVLSALEPDWLLSSKFQLRGMPFNEVRSRPEVLADVLRTVRRALPRLKVACWVFDLMRREFRADRYDWSRQVSAECDRFFCTDSVLASDAGVTNGRLLRQGYPGPDKYGAADPRQACDVLFLGDDYGPRKAWVRALGQEFGAAFRWHRSGVYDHRALLTAVASARVVVGPPHPSYPGYWSNRLYLTAGYGGLFAGPTVEGMLTEGWMNGRHYLNLPGTHDRETCRRLRAYLDPDNSGALDEIRRAGTQLCRDNFTFRHRCVDLVRELETVT